MAAAVAALELVALVVIGLIAIGRPLARGVHARHVAAARGAAAAPARSGAGHVAAAPVVPRLARAQTSVLVLNGNGRAGAAATEAQTLQTLGYRVGRTGNASRSDYAQSLVMYRPGYRPEALRLARDAEIRLVGPLDGLRVRDLGGSQLAVVVGA